MINNKFWDRIMQLEDPEYALHQVNTKICDKKVFTTSFSKEDQIITYFIARNNLDIQIITLDTGRQFEEIYQLHHKTEEWLDVKIKALFPNPKNLESLYVSQGPNGIYSSIANRQKCCEVRKSLPLAVQNYSGTRIHRSALEPILRI